jgi:L-alanine-DL-glutamate epimerase-like enolase superfamily enzyme
MAGPQPSRRDVLAAGAAAAGFACIPSINGANMAAQPRVKIARIETFAVTYPTVGRFKFFEGPDGRPTGRQSVLVKITADDGSVGWGQSVPINKWSYETLETVQTTIERYLAPVLVGKDPFDAAAIDSAIEMIIAPSFSTGQPICKAGIDLALFDLTGTLLKQTAAQRWGRKGKDRLTLSWTLNPVKLDDVPGLIEAGRKRGFANFNIKVAPDLKFDLELTRLVKQLAPDGFLWADANGGYDEATALEAAPKLADAGCAVLEQPVRPNRLGALQKLKKQGALPIILDEGVVSSVELEEFIRLGMLDGVAMKPARCGGLTDARRQVELLEKHGLMFLGSGLTDPDLSLAASLLLYGAYDLKYPAALNGPQFLSGSVLSRPLAPEGGVLTIPPGFGLGVEVDPQRLAELQRRRAG